MVMPCHNGIPYAGKHISNRVSGSQVLSSPA
jgi:hypothetical protein